MALVSRWLPVAGWQIAQPNDNLLQLMIVLIGELVGTLGALRLADCDPGVQINSHPGRKGLWRKMMDTFFEI